MGTIVKIDGELPRRKHVLLEALVGITTVTPLADGSTQLEIAHAQHVTLDELRGILTESTFGLTLREPGEKYEGDA